MWKKKLTRKMKKKSEEIDEKACGNRSKRSVAAFGDRPREIHWANEVNEDSPTVSRRFPKANAIRTFVYLNFIKFI